MPDDFMDLGGPAAVKELDILNSLNVGDIRRDPFMAALPNNLEWVCIKITPDTWTFAGQFCGLPVMTVQVARLHTKLVITRKG